MQYHKNNPFHDIVHTEVEKENLRTTRWSIDHEPSFRLYIGQLRVVWNLKSLTIPGVQKSA